MARIALLEKGWEQTPRPREHQLRRAYALADLYERSGGASVKAREQFRWIATKDPAFADAAERAAVNCVSGPDPKRRQRTLSYPLASVIDELPLANQGVPSALRRASVGVPA